MTTVDKLFEHQQLLSNLINPDTPYRGILCFHGIGKGKTEMGIRIAETFRKNKSKDISLDDIYNEQLKIIDNKQQNDINKSLDIFFNEPARSQIKRKIKK